MSPGSTKIIGRLIEERLPVDEALRVKQGNGRALVMWGRVNYRDIFKEERFLKFAFHFYWIERASEDGKPLPAQLMSADTPGHNDAN
jgi:hypothetical protein